MPTANGRAWATDTQKASTVATVVERLGYGFGHDRQDDGGRVRWIDAVNVQSQGGPDQWRQFKAIADQIKAVERIISDLGVAQTPRLLVFNKMDELTESELDWMTEETKKRADDKLDTFVIPLVEETERRRAAGKPNLFNNHITKWRT